MTTAPRSRFVTGVLFVEGRCVALRRTAGEGDSMGRWPDNSKATLTTGLVMFVVFPLLAALAWWYVHG